MSLLDNEPWAVSVQQGKQDKRHSFHRGTGCKICSRARRCIYRRFWRGPAVDTHVSEDPRPQQMPILPRTALFRVRAPEEDLGSPIAAATKAAMPQRSEQGLGTKKKKTPLPELDHLSFIIGTLCPLHCRLGFQSLDISD
jgi:hypothetical protein